MTNTGQRRSRATPKHVKTAERVARALISTGGIGTIIAVVLIFGFLVSVVLPLFSGGEVSEPRAIAVRGSENTIRMEVDELRLIGYTLDRDGTVTVFSLADGGVLERRAIFPDEKVTAWSFSPDGAQCAFGFDDGTIRFGTIGFSFVFLDEVPNELSALRIGESKSFKKGVVIVTPKKQHRLQALKVELGKPLKAANGSIAQIDYSVRPDDKKVFAITTADGALRVIYESVEMDMMTGEDKVVLDPRDIPYERPQGRNAADHIFVNGGATSLVLIWNDGFGQRFDIRDDVPHGAVEDFQLTDTGDTITAARALVGKSTIMIGTAQGKLDAWFAIKPDLVVYGRNLTPRREGNWKYKDQKRFRRPRLIPTKAAEIDFDELEPMPRDGVEFVCGHRLDPADSALVSMSPSSRSRMLTAAYANGSVRTYQVTTESLVVETEPVAGGVHYVALSPKEDGIYALSGESMRGWNFDPKHPEATFGSLFGRVWYEGYNKPDYAWQSTGGSSSFEPKLSLRPLIYGTIKATTYSILIAAPLALLAAIFTSQFLASRLRTSVKSTIEMMASLPSVVLGFMAAIVIAPYLQGGVPIMLAAFATIPFAILLGARLWQLLPTRKAIQWGGFPRFASISVFLPVGLLLATWIGPLLESSFFGGNLRSWLSDSADNQADGVGGWMLLLMPLCLLVVAALNVYFLAPVVRSISRTWTRKQCALFDVAKLLVQTVVVLLLAWGGAKMLGAGWMEWIGLDADPRGGVLGSYNQLNALVVGFVMGFAIVPIIYTLAEDALSSVPSQLREGSLGAGATPWQTAWRIVIPTSMSGLFGALMVGLGRAVGETMIVLMAAGNTPVMELNMFSGFRTLSANIATELPEAVQGDTHYRALFLAALVLFAMTFCINIFAEGVRRVFRRRFADL